MTDKINDGGPAFPVHGGHGDDDPRNRVLGGGMSLRDWFAGMAMQATMAAWYVAGEYAGDAPEAVADIAYAMADAMLAARAKGGAK